jgi:hypothetical protein
MMVRGRQAILVTIAAAVLVTTASACAGTAQPAASTAVATARPGVNPLKSLTSYQIIGKAFANTSSALNVQITGKITRAGQPTRLSSLSLVNGGSGCVGDVFQAGIGTFQLIYDGTTAWVLPSPDYWKTAGPTYNSLLHTLEGKYLQLKPAASGLGALAGLCSLSALAGTGPTPARRTGFSAARPTTVGGVPALKISDTADGGYATVSETAQPQLLSFYVPGINGGSFSLAYFATPVTVSAPPGTEVVDGTQYGF